MLLFHKSSSSPLRVLVRVIILLVLLRIVILLLHQLLVCQRGKPLPVCQLRVTSRVKDAAQTLDRSQNVLSGPNLDEITITFKLA